MSVIAAEGCALEILPKIDVDTAGETETAAIRRRLVHMLAVALDMRIDVGVVTDPDWQELLSNLVFKRSSCGGLICG